jgi:hypothetical protein
MPEIEQVCLSRAEKQGVPRFAHQLHPLSTSNALSFHCKFWPSGCKYALNRYLVLLTRCRLASLYREEPLLGIMFEYQPLDTVIPAGMKYN